MAGQSVIVILGAATEPSSTYEVCFHRPDGERCATLLDDGTTPGDRADDGLYLARMDGAALRFVDLEIRDASTKEAYFRRIVALPDSAESLLGFKSGRVDGQLAIDRSAWVPVLGGSASLDDPTAVLVGGAWVLIGMVYVGFLGLLRRRTA